MKWSYRVISKSCTKPVRRTMQLWIHSLDLVKKQTFFRNVWNVRRGWRSLTHVAGCETWKVARAFKVRLLSLSTLRCQIDMCSHMWRGLYVFAFCRVSWVQSQARTNTGMVVSKITLCCNIDTALKQNCTKCTLTYIQIEIRENMELRHAMLYVGLRATILVGMHIVICIVTCLSLVVFGWKLVKIQMNILWI